MKGSRGYCSFGAVLLPPPTFHEIKVCLIAYCSYCVMNNSSPKELSSLCYWSNVSLRQCGSHGGMKERVVALQLLPTCFNFGVDLTKLVNNTPCLFFKCGTQVFLTTPSCPSIFGPLASPMPKSKKDTCLKH